MQKSERKKKFSRVYVEITNVCNKDCSFCPGTKRPSRFMSRAEFECVLKKLSPFTDYLYFHLMGEPTLHPDLIEFISIARAMGYRPMITTNGTLLYELSDEIITSGVHKVNISLHSFEKDDKIGHIEYLKSCVDFAKRAAKCGIIVTLRLWNGGTGEDNSSVIEFLHKSFGSSCEAYRGGERLSEKIFLEYADRFAWPDIENEELGADVYCHGLLDHFGILSDGSVVPCCLDRDGVMTLGNAFSDELSDILFGERCESIKEGFKRRNISEPLCKRCSYARRF